MPSRSNHPFPGVMRLLVWQSLQATTARCFSLAILIISEVGQGPRVQREAVSMAVRRVMVTAAWNAVSFNAIHRRTGCGRNDQELCIHGRWGAHVPGSIDCAGGFQAP